MKHVEFQQPDVNRRIQLLTLAALAEKLGTYRQRVYHLVKQGRIKVVELDGVRGVEPAEVQRLMALSAPMITGGGRTIVRFSKRLDREIEDHEI